MIQLVVTKLILGVSGMLLLEWGLLFGLPYWASRRRKRQMSERNLQRKEKGAVHD